MARLRRNLSERAIRNHPIPYFGRKRIAEIKRVDVLECIRPESVNVSRALCAPHSPRDAAGDIVTVRDI